MNEGKKGSSVGHKIFTVLGIVLCVILVPILIMNCVLLIKGVTDPDNVPTVGGIAPMIVLTESMHGTFDGGDLIFVKEAEPADIKVGDIITYFDKGAGENAVTTHRVKEIIYGEDGKPTVFKTKGDANSGISIEDIPASDLIGTYTGFHIPNAGHVAMFMQSTWGFIVCVFVPIVLLVGYDLIRRKMYDKKHTDDKDKLLAELEELRALKAAKEAEASTEQTPAPEAPVEETAPSTEE